MFNFSTGPKQSLNNSQQPKLDNAKALSQKPKTNKLASKLFAAVLGIFAANPELPARSQEFIFEPGLQYQLQTALTEVLNIQIAPEEESIALIHRISANERILQELVAHPKKFEVFFHFAYSTLHDSISLVTNADAAKLFLELFEKNPNLDSYPPAAKYAYVQLKIQYPKNQQEAELAKKLLLQAVSEDRFGSSFLFVNNYLRFINEKMVYSDAGSDTFDHAFEWVNLVIDSIDKEDFLKNINEISSNSFWRIIYDTEDPSQMHQSQSEPEGYLKARKDINQKILSFIRDLTQGEEIFIAHKNKFLSNFVQLFRYYTEPHAQEIAIDYLYNYSLKNPSVTLLALANDDTFAEIVFNRFSGNLEDSINEFSDSDIINKLSIKLANVVIGLLKQQGNFEKFIFACEEPNKILDLLVVAVEKNPTKFSELAEMIISLDEDAVKRFVANITEFDSIYFLYSSGNSIKRKLAQKLLQTYNTLSYQQLKSSINKSPEGFLFFIQGLKGELSKLLESIPQKDFIDTLAKKKGSLSEDTYLAIKELFSDEMAEYFVYEYTLNNIKDLGLIGMIEHPQGYEKDIQQIVIKGVIDYAASLNSKTLNPENATALIRLINAMHSPQLTHNREKIIKVLSPQNRLILAAWGLSEIFTSTSTYLNYLLPAILEDIRSMNGFENYLNTVDPKREHVSRLITAYTRYGRLDKLQEAFGEELHIKEFVKVILEGGLKDVQSAHTVVELMFFDKTPETEEYLFSIYHTADPALKAKVAVLASVYASKQQIKSQDPKVHIWFKKIKEKVPIKFPDKISFEQLFSFSKETGMYTHNQVWFFFEGGDNDGVRSRWSAFAHLKKAGFKLAKVIKPQVASKQKNKNEKLSYTFVFEKTHLNKKVVIYLSPIIHEEEENKSEKIPAQLDTLIKTGKVHNITYRGHSTFVPEFARFIERYSNVDFTNSIFNLGSCGGVLSIQEVASKLKYMPEYWFATEGTGSTQVNDPLFVSLANEVLSVNPEGALDFVEFKKKISKKLSAIDKFRHYQFPHENIPALLVALFEKIDNKYSNETEEELESLE